ncbi:hypothetical protein [Peredibacter starrii]|uniref:Uncharacterized protein n=1 Tax=Peredibacter starrii TaxID=28202 RepID=A0AAX4HRZ1_9BACT|nr:hypothetical protein [Peredibacter starrii]WPU66145.1 hypothetical protein SOO65_05240 [Peredibacter starrii]
MKKITSFLLIGLLTYGQVHAQSQGFKSPDIIVDTRLDYDWTSFLISKFRVLLKNYNVADPFSNRFEGEMVVNEDVVGNYLPADSKVLIDDFGNAVGLNVLKAKTKVTLHGLAYDVKGFKTNMKAAEQARDGLVVGTNFSASEVTVTADKISLSLVIPGKNNSPVFNVDIIRPEIQANEEELVNFFTKVKIQDQKDHFKLQIIDADFDKMASGMLKHPENIELNYERINIPSVSLRVGSKVVQFSQTKIQNLLRENHEAIKGILLAQLAGVLNSNTTDAAFKVLESYKIKKEFWLNSSILNSQFMISNFSSYSRGNNIAVSLPADFCTAQKFTQLKAECVNNKVTQTALSRLNSQLHKESLNNMNDMMASGDANLVVSISEDYLNKLLVTTYDAGLWKSALDEAAVELGPSKMVLRMDKRGETGTLMLDVIYRPSKMEKMLTGSTQIRFPLVVDVSIRIENKNDVPTVVVRMNDVDSNDDTIINGRPKENMTSTVKNVPRFQGKVAKAIREKISVLRNKDIVELKYPEFKGLGLDKVEFLSDGNGRMNAIMDLDDLISSKN